MMTPCEGSIQWAMDRGHLYDVRGGGFQYGQMVTCADGPCEAANIAMWKGDSYSVWLPPGRVLTVWNVYAGGIGGFCMKDPREFVVRNGEAIPCA